MVTSYRSVKVFSLKSFLLYGIQQQCGTEQLKTTLRNEPRYTDVHVIQHYCDNQCVIHTRTCAFIHWYTSFLAWHQIVGLSVHCHGGNKNNYMVVGTNHSPNQCGQNTNYSISFPLHHSSLQMSLTAWIWNLDLYYEHRGTMAS